MQDKKFNKLFAYLISHEFKTPLTTIFGYAQMLQRKYDPDWNQEIVKQAIRMNLILDQGVTFNRLYYKNLEFTKTTTSLKNVFELASKKYVLAFPQKTLPEIKQDIEIDTDESKLSQALLDLLFLSQSIEVLKGKLEFHLSELSHEKNALYQEVVEGNWENIKNAEEVGLWVDAEIVKLSGGRIELSGNSITIFFDGISKSSD